MSLTILDPTVAAAVAAATSQEGQRTALLAPWAGGDVTVRAVNGATLRETETYGPWALVNGTPRTMTLGPLLARTVSSTGVPTSFVFRAGSTDIFSLSAAVSPAAGDIVLPAASGGISALARTNLSDPVVGKVTITANPALPVADVVATGFTLSVSPLTALNGVPATVTVTPNGQIPPGGLSASLSASNGGTLGTASMSFTGGATGSQSTTIVRATTGASVVSMTNTGGLSNGLSQSFSSTAPVAPPTPGATIATLTLLTAGAGTYPWTAGHAFKPGDVPNGAPLAGLQINVKSQWPDGSAKIAIVSGIATAAGTSTDVAIGTGAPPSAAWLTTTDLKATSITASIGTPSGSVSWATTDWDSPFLTWVEGPLMSSWIFRKAVGSDAHLTAWLEVRLWSTGNVEVLPWIENGYLTVASPTAKPGAYSFTLGGTSRFSATLPVEHHTRAVLVSGSTLSHWLGADKTTTPKHSAAYLAQTGLVSAYLSDVARSSVPSFPTSGGVPASLTPYEQLTATNTNLPTAMGSGGGHPSIGIAPAWEMVALTVAGELAHSQMIRESLRFGQYHTHYRDEATNRPLKFSSHGDKRLSIAGLARTGVDYVEGTGAATVVPYPVADADTNQWQQWVPSHQPASPLLAYITTGRFWFMEECQFVATLNFLGQASYRNGSDGIVTPSAQMRQAAWTIRNLFIAACVTPEDDPLKTDFDTAVQKNVEYYHDRNITIPGNPFGITETQTRSAGDWGGAQAWQVDFWTAAWGRCISMRLGATQTIRQKARAFFDWVAQSIVGRMGDPVSTTAWSYRDLSAFIDVSDATGGLNSRVPFIWPGSGISITTNGTNTVTGTYPDYATGAGPWWSNWGAMYDYMMTTQAGLVRAGGDGSSIRGSFLSDIDGNFWNSFQASVAAASLGVSGATAGLARVRGASNWNTIKSNAVGQNATNALEVVTLAQEDFSSFIPAAGARSNINLNSAAEIDFDVIVAGTDASRWWNGYGGTNSFRSMITSFAGGIHAPTYGIAGAVIAWGGGHGGQIGNFAYLFDFASRTWKQVGASRNLPPTALWSGYTNAKDVEAYSSAFDQRDLQWMDYDWNGSKITFAGHTYHQNVHVSAAEGGGRLGSLLIPQADWHQDPSRSDPRTGLAQRWAPRLLDLDTGKTTRASASMLGNITGYSNTIAVKDNTRGRVWYFEHGTPVCSYHTLGSGPPYTKTAHTIQKVGGGDTDTFTAVRNASWLYVPEADAIIQFIPANSGDTPGLDQTCVVRVMSMSTGVPIDLKRTITGQSLHHGGIYIGAAWSPTLSKFYLYEGYGDDYCYVLTPSSLDFSTCTWAWTREQFSGATPVTRNNNASAVADQINAVLGKWQWVPAYGCFALHDGPLTSGVCADGVTRTGIVQLWHPPGTTI